MQSELNKTKLTLAYILLVLVLTFVWTELLVGEIMEWDSDFDPIDLPSITSKNQPSVGSSSVNLSIDGDVLISADNTTAAQLSFAVDTLVTEYRLTFDGDGISATGGTSMETWTDYRTFLSTPSAVTHVTNPDDNDVVITLHVRASNYPNDLADAGEYKATQTLTVQWAP